MSLALDAYFARTARVWDTPSALPPSEWATKNLRLPPRGIDGNNVRPSWDNRPYLRKPLDDLANPSCEEIVVVAPTRSGKTFIERIGLAWGVAADPAPQLWFDSTVDKGRGFMRKEFQPLVQYNRLLRDCKPSNRHDYTAGMMLFPGAPLTVFGANSDAQASGETAMRVFGNEIDKWRAATEKEASILEQVRHRTESYEQERKHMFSSTPTLESGPIWKCYLRGTREVWVVCFPGGQFHELVWENVVWDQQARISDHEWDLDAVLKTARYRDPSTGQLWDDAARLAAVAGGHYEATNPKPIPRVHSYHINGLCGPLQVNRLGELAVAFLDSRQRGFYVDRQDFWNGRMGLPWKDDISTLSSEKFAALERDYVRGSVPDGFQPDILIFGVDDQTWGFPWLLTAFKWSGEAYVVDWGIADSDKALEELQVEYHVSLKPRSSSHVILDINFEEHRSKVIDAIFKRQRRGWIGAEGFEMMKEPVRIERANAFIGGKLQTEKRTFPKLQISNYEFKCEIEKRLSGEIEKLFFPHLPILASDLDAKDHATLYEQLSNERRVPRKRKALGKPDFEFKAKGPNHFYDCAAYAHALFWFLSRRRSARARAAGSRREVQVKS